MKDRLFDLWGARQRRRQCSSRDPSHPTLWVVLALVAALLGAASAAFWRSADDDPKLEVFDPKVRGHTDKFALRFRKPS